MSPESLIENSKVAAVISDPRQPDNPIIACNQAFIALTGYTSGQIIGRNCRFLRGPLTESEKTAELRDAVRERRPTMVELTNYKKDGRAFLNAVMIAPLFDDEGGLSYFLGSQIEISGPTDPSRRDARARIEGLSPRQRQMIELLARGMLNKQIAYQLNLTERTVKMHRAAMLRALDVRTVAEAIRIAIEAGL